MLLFVTCYISNGWFVSHVVSILSPLQRGKEIEIEVCERGVECDTSKYGYGYGYQAKRTLHERRTRGERTRTASSIFCLGIEAVTGFRGCEAGPNPSAMPCCIFLLQRLTKLKLSGLLLYDNEHRIEAQTGHSPPAGLPGVATAWPPSPFADAI